MIRGRVEYLNSPEHTMQQFGRAYRLGLEHAAEFWHRVYMPGHFTEEASRKYGYQKRSGEGESNLIYKDGGRAVRQGKHGSLVQNPKYYWKKWRKKKHHRALVYTGDSERDARRTVRLSSRRSSGTTFQASAVMNLPKYFYQYTKAGTYVRRGWGGNQAVVFSHDTPNKVKELLTTLPSEETVLAEVARRATIRELNAMPARRESRAASMAMV